LSVEDDDEAVPFSHLKGCFRGKEAPDRLIDYLRKRTAWSLRLVCNESLDGLSEVFEKDEFKISIRIWRGPI